MWYTSMVWRHHGLRRHPDWVVGIAGPLLVIAVLFLVNWLKHDELRARP
jgi:hypothetical protein